MFVYGITTLLVAFFASRVHMSASDGSQVKNNLNKSNKFFVILTAAVLIFVAGFRWKVGTDYNTYISLFNRYISDYNAYLNLFDGPLFVFFAKLTSFLCRDYWIFFFGVACLTIGLYVRTIAKYSKMFLFSILLYIFIGAWNSSFNGMRQYLAAAVLFAGHRFLIDKKFLRYCAVVIIASLVHVTALIMLPVYFVSYLKINLKTIIILAIGAFALRYSYDYLFNIMSGVKGSEQSGYGYMTNSVNLFRVLVSFSPLALFLFVPKNKLNENDNTIYFNMLLVNAAFMFATANSTYLARIGIYTDIYITLALPRMLRWFKAKEKAIVSSVIVIFYAIFWWYELWIRGSLETFQWIWNR